MHASLHPHDPGYAGAVAQLLARAKAINPHFRLATAHEKTTGDPGDLYTFSGSDGCMIAPIFVLDAPRKDHPLTYPALHEPRRRTAVAQDLRATRKNIQRYRVAQRQTTGWRCALAQELAEQYRNILVGERSMLALLYGHHP
jgi:hypothetical protein